MKMHQDAGGGGDTAQPEGLAMNPDFWRTIFDAIGAPLFLHDGQFRVLLANRAYCRAAGMTEAETLGKPYWEVFPRGTGPLPGCKNATIVKGNIHSHDEVNAGEKLFLSTGYLVRDDQGNVLYALHILGDITAQRQSEDALRKSKDMLQYVVENVPARIFWKDRDSRFLGCNTRFAQDAGRSSPDELTGKTDFEMGWKDQAELYRADDKAVMESGTPKLDIEEPQTTPDGNTIWLRTSKVPLRDEGNHVIGILGIYQDITERKWAEKRLGETQEKIQKIFDSSPDAIYLIDLNGIVVECNQTTVNLHGYSTKEELHGTNGFNLVVENERQRAMELLGELVSRGTMHNVELTMLRRDGSQFMGETAGSVLRDSSGKPTGLVVITTDITQRKQAEEKLRETRDFLENLFNHANAPIIVWNPSCQITMFNHAFERMAGRDANEVIGKQIDILFPPDCKDEALSHIHQTQTGERWETIEIPILHSSGKVRTALWNSATLYSADGKKVVATMAQGQDITERKQAEANLAEQLEELRRWHDTTLGREMRILELKHEVNQLLGQSGQPPRYPSAESPEQKEE